jgi:hypothetical protein
MAGGGGGWSLGPPLRPAFCRGHDGQYRAPHTLDALAHAAWQLEPPTPHEKKSVLRPEAAHLVDSLLARVARGRGALDVAIGGAL